MRNKDNNLLDEIQKVHLEYLDVVGKNSKSITSTNRILLNILAQLSTLVALNFFIARKIDQVSEEEGV